MTKPNFFKTMQDKVYQGAEYGVFVSMFLIGTHSAFVMYTLASSEDWVSQYYAIQAMYSAYKAAMYAPALGMAIGGVQGAAHHCLDLLEENWEEDTNGLSLT